MEHSSHFEAKQYSVLRHMQGEIAAVILPLFKAEELKFTAAGREDKDVRMLGTGRPFVAQVSNPLTPVHAIVLLFCSIQHYVVGDSNWSTLTLVHNTYLKSWHKLEYCTMSGW
jgi:hypothetical protein